MGMLDNLVLVLWKYELWENALYWKDHFSKKKSFSKSVCYIQNRRQRFSKQPSEALAREFWWHEDVWGIQKITLKIWTTFFRAKNGIWVKSRANGSKNTIEAYKVIFRNNQTTVWDSFAHSASLDVLLQDLCLRFLISPSNIFFSLASIS